MGCCENKYNVSSTAPATEALKNWRGCCWWWWCWCCCFAAKKQALLCVNILFSRNLKTVFKWLSWLHLHSVHQQIDKPASDLQKPSAVHKVLPCLIHSRENWRVPCPGFTAKADKVVKQTVEQMKQPEKRVNQSGRGAANWAAHPILPDNSIHTGIRILLIREGAARNRVLGEAWTKVPRDLLKSDEDRVWCIRWRAGAKQRGIKVKSQGRGIRRDDWKQSRGSQMIAENHDLSGSHVCPS